MMPELMNHDSYKQWLAEGGRDANQRAVARARQLLAECRPPPLDESIDEELRDPVKGFRGYCIERTEEVSEASLRPGGWVQHISAADRQNISYDFATAEPFAQLVVLRRREGETMGRSVWRCSLSAGSDL